MKKNILDCVTGQGRVPPPLRFLLRLCSGLWRSLIRARHFAYDHQFFKSYRSSLPTLSIGNIAVGGTGKTPLVHLVAEALQTNGQVAILTRGFRSQFEKQREPIQISRGEGPLFSVEACGDEPYFLAQQTRAWIWVGRNRCRSARAAERAGAACLILDDGMQHRKLERTLEIVVVDGTDPLKQGRLIPAGGLRDLPERLKGADLIVATHIQSDAHYEAVKKELSRYTQAPLVAMEHHPLDPGRFAGKKVGAFCGIGNPEHFYALLRSYGAEVVAVLTLRDHEKPSQEKLAAFAAKCKEFGAESLVCTEKDQVKLEPHSTLLPVMAFPVRLQITRGREEWDSIIEKMKTQMLR